MTKAKAKAYKRMLMGTHLPGDLARTPLPPCRPRYGDGWPRRAIPPPSRQATTVDCHAHTRGYGPIVAIPGAPTPFARSEPPLPPSADLLSWAEPAISRLPLCSRAAVDFDVEDGLGRQFHWEQPSEAQKRRRGKKNTPLRRWFISVGDILPTKRLPDARNCWILPRRVHKRSTPFGFRNLPPLSAGCPFLNEWGA